MEQEKNKVTTRLGNMAGPVRLRRMRVPDSVTVDRTNIAQNLDSVIIDRRKIAQDIYYGKREGNALATSVTDVEASSSKPPVHQRLGYPTAARRMGLLRRKNACNNIATARTRLRLKRTNNGINSTATFVKRRLLAQQRLNRIRRENLISMGGLRTQKLRLRRQRPLIPQTLTNYIVQVDNTANHSQQNNSEVVTQHSVKNSINQIRQFAIKEIQSRSFLNHEINRPLPLPICVPGFGMTCLSLNERFSNLP